MPFDKDLWWCKYRLDVFLFSRSLEMNDFLTINDLPTKSEESKSDYVTLFSL